MNQRIIKNLEELQDLPEGETAKWEHPENGTTHVFEFKEKQGNVRCDTCAINQFHHNCLDFCDSEYREDQKTGIFVELSVEQPKND